jgi:tRNA-splicing ligase RtcB
LADRHIKLAKAQHQALEDPDLSFFLEGTPEFMAYVDDMLWAQAYAMTNRRLMMDAALTDLFSLAPGQEVARINCHHNFAQQEWHTVYENGRLTEGLVWVTRKGAIRAELGDMGVIPGSMATGSFIVRGKQNTHSYNSASHGAGRRMSRTQARKTLTTESLVESMRGIAWNGDAKGLLDEHRDAYKDLNTIMTAQDNLVAIVHSLKTVANYKGS